MLKISPNWIKNVFKIWTTETTSAEIPPETNIKIIVSIESFTLFLRYCSILVVLVGNTLDIFQQNSFLTLFLICTISHIIFTHIVFFLKQYSLFSNPLNFLLYLLTITSLVTVTDKEYSPLILLYPLLSFGNLIYAQKRPHPLITTLLSLIVLDFTIIGIWTWEGIKWATYFLFWENLMILIAGFFCYFLLNYIQQVRRENYQKQQELLYTQGIIKSILDSIQSPILIFDEREIITDINSYASQFFEMEPSELIGQRVQSLFFDDTVIGEALLSLRTRSNVNINALALTSNGEEIPVDFIVQVFYQNQRKFFFGILIDKSEHKRLEEISQLLHKREEEINNKIALLKDLQSDLSSYYTAHIFTYITTIKNVLHSMIYEQLGIVTERQKQALEIAVQALEKMENEFQRFRKETGPVPSTATEFLHVNQRKIQ